MKRRGRVAGRGGDGLARNNGFNRYLEVPRINTANIINGWQWYCSITSYIVGVNYKYIMYAYTCADFNSRDL